MRKGDVPVPYIIALILGIIVVGLLAFWFFVLGGQLPISNAQATCNANINTYCAAWAACGYESGCDPAGASATQIDWEDYSSACLSVNVPKPTEYTCKQSQGLRANGAACTLNSQCASNNCVASVCTA